MLKIESFVDGEVVASVGIEPFFSYTTPPLGKTVREGIDVHKFLPENTPYTDDPGVIQPLYIIADSFGDFHLFIRQTVASGYLTIENGDLGLTPPQYFGQRSNHRFFVFLGTHYETAEMEPLWTAIPDSANPSRLVVNGGSEDPALGLVDGALVSVVHEQTFYGRACAMPLFYTTQENVDPMGVGKSRNLYIFTRSDKLPVNVNVGFGG